MSDNAFVLWIIGLLVGGVALIVSISCYYCYRSDQQMIQAGYVKQSTPVSYNEKWIKPEPK